VKKNVSEAISGGGGRFFAFCHALPKANASELCLSVNDPANLPVPKVWVNVTALLARDAVGPPETYNMTTDAKGKACLAVPEGTYSVEVGMTGFLNVRYYPVRVIYPFGPKLVFRLPFGELTEGGMTGEADLVGTLLYKGKPAEYVEVCVLKNTSDAIIACGKTNYFGEYALSVPPGTYRTEIRTHDGKVFRSNITVSIVGRYRNQLVIPLQPPAKN
jgi:hypothetical protein